MVNFYFADDANRHICELQLCHARLMTVRKGFLEVDPPPHQPQKKKNSSA